MRLRSRNNRRGYRHAPNLVCLMAAVSALFAGGLAPAADLPSPEKVLAAMERAVGFYTTHLSVEGGYASAVKKDLSTGYTEHRESPTLISIQPHGTTTVGLRMLDAYRVTGDTRFRDGAAGAVAALTASQLSSGGWEKDFDFDPDFVAGLHTRRQLEEGDTDPGKRKRTATLDDHKTTSALQLLLEYVHADGVDPSPEVVRALEFGRAALLGAQFPNGGWAQRFDGPADASLPVLAASLPDSWPREWSKKDYTRYVTLNDGNLGHIMTFLLRAHELTGKPEYREAALRLGDFFLLAQLPAPQTAWAQQYDENMHPVWARKFEPPAVSSVESLDSAEALALIWEASGEERFREAALQGLDWILRSRLEDGSWARFYELGTNRPLYCDADTYELTYKDTHLPAHYGFKIDAGLGSKVERLRERFRLTPAEARARRSPSSHPESRERRARSLRSKVEAALAAQEKEGYWLEDDRIDAGLFVKHMAVLTDYLESRSPPP